MDTPILVAIISAAAAVVVPAVSYFYTKKKEREADWRKYKFEHYRELVMSISDIVGSDSSPEGQRRFAAACNTLHLIGSARVLNTLHEFQDEIGPSNTNRSRERHDAILTRLMREIRADLGIPHTSDEAAFAAHLWCSGTNRDSGPPSASGTCPPSD